MSKQWINFKDLRERITFSQLLAHYQVEPRQTKGSQISCFCPLPDHGGQKNSPSFSAENEKGIFNCFGCGAKGNLLDFAVRMEGGDPKDGKVLRTVALKLAKEFDITSERPSRRKSEPEDKTTGDDSPKPSDAVPPSEHAEEPHPKVEINGVLNFELKSLDPAHAFFTERGLAPNTVHHFGLGYASKGLMKGRIAIPIHNGDGGLIAYAGRLVDAERDGETPPSKYLLPAPREKDGIRHEFHKSEVIYNGWRLGKGLKELLVVEGFPDVWHLWQHGHPHVCGILGSSCSETQARLILSHTKPDATVTFLFDGDEAGRRCTRETFLLLGQHRRCRWIPMAEGTDVAMTPCARLNELLT